MKESAKLALRISIISLLENAVPAEQNKIIVIPANLIRVIVLPVMINTTPNKGYAKLARSLFLDALFAKIKIHARSACNRRISLMKNQKNANFASNTLRTARHAHRASALSV